MIMHEAHEEEPNDNSYRSCGATSHAAGEDACTTTREWSAYLHGLIQICIPKSNFREPWFTLRLRRSRGYAQGERGTSPLQLQTVRAERSVSEVEARTRKLLNEL
jgi:hypothetical protein